MPSLTNSSFNGAALLNDRDPTQGNIRELLQLIKPQSVKNFAKVRVGSRNDGGYIMVDDFDNADIAFSLGIDTNDEWDVEIANRGIDVKQYDHTIKRAPSVHERLSFFPMRVVVTGAPNCVSFAEMVADYTDQSKCILKVDIEGDEWELLDHVPSGTITCFSQIVCEFHYFHRLRTCDFFDRAIRVLRKLSLTHQAVHVHANNFAPVCNLSKILVPVVLEVTYVRRNTYELVQTDEVFPTSLDAPNDDTLPDIFLGNIWRDVSSESRLSWL